MSIQVAVRVRPFNSREIELGSELCVAMEGNKTTLISLEDPKKNREFFFDFSFWSHSGFENNETGLSVATDSHYSDQRKVYDLVGAQMLDNAWEGYHCCLLAYGQTGAGKSYSMVGYKPNRGIVPIACEEIFKRISACKEAATEYEVCVSMLEIYNEKVQDLLVPLNKRSQGGLRIRENRTIGFYVEHLTKHPVKSYEAIEQRMEEGSKNRTIAATQMNASSSRAHTIITVEFRKREMVEGRKMEKFSLINLVDLAGSEKVGKTGATGDRLKEAGQINKSLHILGLVISTLAEIESGKKHLKVPYRDSCLTKILCNALGGNSKTLMICAISPSNDNYDETLSTLRYADQAKKIKNKAIVNETAVDKMIRELTEENQKLKSTIQELRLKMLQNPNNLSAKQVEELEEELQAMDDLMNDMKITHQQRVEEQEKEDEDNEIQEENIDQKIHLTNLNEDPVLNNKILFALDKEYTYVGRKNATPLPDIVLGSMGIKEKHAIFIRAFDKLYLVPYEESCSEYIHLNGERLMAQTELYHNDRIVFGSNSTFLVKIPNGQQRKGQVLPKEIDWEFAQEEISKKSEKLINKNDNKEEELKEETLQKMKLFEQQRQAEKDESEMKIKEQKQIYEQKLVELEDKMKEESEKQKLEKEKLEAERQCNEIVQKLEAERIQKELEREKQKQSMQAEEHMRLYKIRSKQTLEQKLQKALPKIYEVGFISKELKRDIVFSPKILYTYTDQSEINTMKEKSKMPKIQILIQNNEEGSEYVWDLEKFQNRYYIIKGLLDRYFETNQIPDLQQTEDPFWDPPEPFLIGQGFLKLLGLAYGLDSQTQITLVGDSGQCGSLHVGFVPCNETGDIHYDDENANDDLVVEDPNDLLNQRLDFKLFIKNGVLPSSFCTDTFVEYSILNQENNRMAKYKTSKIEGKNPTPSYNYSFLHSYQNIQQNVIKYLSNNTIQFKVFGFDDDRIEKMKQQKLARKSILNQKKLEANEKQNDKKVQQNKEQKKERQEGVPQILKIENKHIPQKVSELKQQQNQGSARSSAATSLSGSKLQGQETISPEKGSMNSDQTRKVNLNPPLSARGERINTEPDVPLSSQKQEGKGNTTQKNEVKRRNSQDNQTSKKDKKKDKDKDKEKDKNCQIF